MTSIPRVLIAAHYFPPHVGGIERVAFMEANELSRRHGSVHVITSSTGADRGPAGTDERVTVQRVRSANPLQRFGVPFPLFWLPSLITASWRAVRRCDVAHVHDALYLSSWTVALLCRLLRKPYLVTQHVAVVAHPSALVNFVQRLIYATFGRMVWRGAKTVFFLNSRVRDCLVDWGVDPDRLRPLANGVSLVDFRPVRSDDERSSIRRDLSLPLDDPLVLFVGRLVPKKGYLRVVAAAVKQDLWQAVMVGDGAQVTGARNVVWLGQRDQDELSQLYRACNVFVLPSEAEGFPLTIQEAMASGLPVVTSRDPGYAMYGLDDELVRFIDDGDDDIESVITSVIDDEQLRLGMARYSRAFAESQFSWSRHVDDLLSAVDAAG